MGNNDRGKPWKNNFKTFYTPLSYFKIKYIRKYIENILFLLTINCNQLKINMYMVLKFSRQNICHSFQITLDCLYKHNNIQILHASYIYLMKLNQLFNDIKNGKKVSQMFLSLSFMPQKNSHLFWSLVESQQIYWDYYWVLVQISISLLSYCINENI